MNQCFRHGVCWILRSRCLLFLQVEKVQQTIKNTQLFNNSNFLSIAIDYSCLTTEVMQILLCFQLSITLVREESQNVFRTGGGSQMPSKPSILQSLCTRKALLYFVFPFLGSFINLVFSYLLCPSCLPALFFAFLFS